MNVLHQNNHAQRLAMVLQQKPYHRYSMPGGVIRTYSGCTQRLLWAAPQMLCHSRHISSYRPRRVAHTLPLLQCPCASQHASSLAATLRRRETFPALFRGGRTEIPPG